MGVKGYNQAIRWDVYATLPTTPSAGMSPFAYVEDTQRHYMFSNGVWYLIPNNLEVDRVQTSAGTAAGTSAYLGKAVTNASGIATIYLTSNGLSTGSAAFTTVYEDGIVAMPIGSTSNYQVVSVVLSGDKKSIAVTVNQLGSVILGLVNVTSAASGIEVRAIVMGK